MLDKTAPNLTLSGWLHAMADLIEKRGHVQGALEGRCGELCIEGAAHTVLFGEVKAWDVSPDLWAINDAITKHLGCEYADTHSPAVMICHWNNMPGRTAAEVVTMLRNLAQLQLWETTL